MAITLTNEEKRILKNVSIPPRPEVLIQFSQETKKPEPNISAIANILHADIGISAAVLQVVNSAAFRRSREIESIDQAIMTLGLKRLVPLVKAVALKSTVGHNSAMADFWEAQTEIAQYASVLANALQKPSLANHAYMLGLFHFVGVPILNQHFDDYEKIISLADESGWDLAAVQEMAQYKTNHATIGSLLAAQWGLPKIMVYVIYYMHDVEGIFSSGELDSTGLGLLSILKVARHSAFLKANPDKEDPEWQAVQEDILDFLKIDESELSDLILSIDE
ncbi:HDOD domain-containing protein [Pseudoalteromonas sp. JBTF-M23]|uniref:HDOD domain-containing protein n=1 Tax=Pseudoalteromonas caenipelagi TaxID=2726988 RepID=A0A849V7C1_9GAMM|nr:HDOD domain-containing protein [Pseudoalteromonas caenipelagi]NOU49232.1 HDOD domain-containing protein [Pseudoalteromonas caenipelagi]